MYIFDNGLSRQDLSEYEPPDSNNNFLLITSHESDWGDDIESFKLGPLPLDSALDIFKTILKTNYRNEDQELYEDLARIVGNVPLGLQITGGYIRHQTKILKETFQLGEYIELLNESEEDIFEEPIPSGVPNTYKNTLYGAIKVALDKIQTVRLGDLVLKILYVCSYLNPNRIELEVLLKIPNIKYILGETRQGVLKLKNALTLLKNYSFVNYNPVDSYVMLHRLIQSIVRFHLDKYHPEEQSSCYTACLQYVIDSNNLFLFKYIDQDIFILELADRYVDIFYIFYQKHASKMNEKLDSFFHKMIATNNIKCIEKVIEASGDKKKEFITKFNLLHKAACWEHINIMTCLLNFGADLNARDCNGYTALFYFIQTVCENEHFNKNEVTEILNILECKRNSNISNYNNNTLLYTAAGWCREELVSLLLTDYEMNVNHQDLQGDTPLHKVILSFDELYRSEEDVIRTLEALKRHGASLDIRNEDGKTPLRIAQEKGAEFLIPYLQTETVAENLGFVEDHFVQGNDSDLNCENLQPGNDTYLSNKKRNLNNICR